MIDIHTHILPRVDDGSESTEKSVELLKILAGQGVTDIVLTPHHRGEYLLDAEKLQSEFSEFKAETERQGINVRLYLGQEIFVCKSLSEKIQNGKLLTLNESKYVLIEFPYKDYYDISETVYELRRKGYIPVVAHPERYEYLSDEDIKEIKMSGGLIQVNSSTVLKESKCVFSGRIKKWIKNGLIDFIGSDIHDGRCVDMLSAYKWVEKKFGRDTAENLFEINAEKILKG